jgi:hypothetical protein
MEFSSASTAPVATLESDLLNTRLAFTLASDCSMGFDDSAANPDALLLPPLPLLLPLLPLDCAAAVPPLLLTFAAAAASSAAAE